MKKVLKSMPFFSALGFKNQMLALAVCVGVGMGTIHSAEAAPARNVNPPALKASAPNVYVVKKGDTHINPLGHLKTLFEKSGALA